MLAKQYRLPAHVSLKVSRVLQTPSFTMKITTNDLPYNRFAFIVSKQVDKRATTRNSVKRKFRSIIEELFNKLLPGHDVLFILRKRLLTLERALMVQELTQSLVRGGLLQ